MSLDSLVVYLFLFLMSVHSRDYLLLAIGKNGELTVNLLIQLAGARHTSNDQVFTTHPSSRRAHVLNLQLLSHCRQQHQVARCFAKTRTPVRAKKQNLRARGNSLPLYLLVRSSCWASQVVGETPNSDLDPHVEANVHSHQHLRRQSSAKVDVVVGQVDSCMCCK